MNMSTVHKRTVLPVSVGFALVISLTACTLLVNRGSDQCSTDADCVSFGSHPYCRSGVCVASGLGPPGCYFGTPQNAGRVRERVHDGGVRAVRQLRAARALRRRGHVQMDLLSAPADLGAVPAPINSETLPAITCKDASRPNLIYVTGSTNFPPLLQAVAPLLAANSPPYTVVFQPQTSCKGAASIFDPDPTQTPDQGYRG